MALAVVPFALSWFLQEVPLRTSNRSAELASEQSGTGTARADELVEPLV
jgi:hypothetical protein